METQPSACHLAPLPEHAQLTDEQALGQACVVCGKLFEAGRFYRGPIFGYDGAMLLDVDVWSCPRPAVGQ